MMLLSLAIGPAQRTSTRRCSGSTILISAITSFSIDCLALQRDFRYRPNRARRGILNHTPSSVTALVNEIVL